MTREEAIEILKQFKKCLSDVVFDEKGSEAWQMAIQALSQVTEVRKLILQAERAGVHLDYGAYLFMNALEKVVGEKQIGEFEQEPCEDDGVDHEKIRKAFAKESDIKKADIADMVTKVIMQAEEETDRFIFNTIRPYCEEITQQEISKEILSKALTQYFSKPTECDDAISREDVEECKELMTDINGDTVYAVRMSDIRQLPSVTHKSGKWIEHEIKDTCRWLTCSNCGYEWINRKENYCPNCGAKMESEDKE